MSFLPYVTNDQMFNPFPADALLTQLNTLVNCLTGLERILTTPIPSSYVLFYLALALETQTFLPRYRIHIWVILCLYLLALVRCVSFITCP